MVCIFLLYEYCMYVQRVCCPHVWRPQATLGCQFSPLPGNKNSSFWHKNNDSQALGMEPRGWVLLQQAQGPGFGPSELKKEATQVQHNRFSELDPTRFVGVVVFTKAVF